MSAICPQGHASQSADFCDECGTPIAGLPGKAMATLLPDALPAGVSKASPSTPGSLAAAGEPCPVCKAPRTGDDRFCESCGYDFVSAVGPARVLPSTPAAMGQWELVVAADRSYYERQASAGVAFPPDSPPRTVALDRDEVRIGRRTASPGLQLEIALEDPAISRLHVVLVRSPDGHYTLVDPGSTNGTTLNDDAAPVRPNVAVPLSDGDRIHLGAWTTLTIRFVPGGAGRG